MRPFALCCLSALLGGLIAVAVTETLPVDEVAAQEQQAPPSRQGRRGPGFPNLPGPTPREPQTSHRPSEPRYNAAGLSPEEAVNVAVYEKTNRSVVHITTKSARLGGFFLLEVPTEGTGSGAIIDKSGHIVTNYHVIEDARHVAVTLHNGETYPAQFVGADPINDLAVIQVDAPQDELHPITLGDSRKLKVGMRVFALGNPFGLQRTMSTGIIASLNRSLQIRGNRTIKSIIQVDAAVNPGNSGGPLVDTHGRLIGITTAIATKTGQSAGVGFAIPVSLIDRVVPSLIEHGRVIRPTLGIKRFYETERGLLVARLDENGPADRAGVHGPKIVRRRQGPFVFQSIDRTAADLIVAVDGEEVRTVDDLLSYVESQDPGDEVVLKIVRGGNTVEIPVTLGTDEE